MQENSQPPQTNMSQEINSASFEPTLPPQPANISLGALPSEKPIPPKKRKIVPYLVIGAILVSLIVAGFLMRDKLISLVPGIERSTDSPENDSTSFSVNDLTYMQDLASLSDSEHSSVVASMENYKQYQLVDSRDDKAYYIVKLPDGNIWMTQNLDLDLDSSKTYTNKDTDIGWNSKTNRYNSASWTPTNSTIHAASAEEGFPEDTTVPQSLDPGDLYWTGEVRSLSLENTSTSGNPHYHLGNYYNWIAASAQNSDDTLEAQNILVDQSICPAGWTLPRAGNGEDSYYALFADSASDDSQGGKFVEAWEDPLYFAFSGVVLVLRYQELFSSSWSAGSEGAYWSSVASYFDDNFDGSISEDEKYAYTFSLSANLSGTSGSAPRYMGASVRCIARPVSSSVSFENF